MEYKIFLSLISILFLFSCEESSKTVISVANDYAETGKGTMVASIENEGSPIQFKSKVSIEEGKFSFYLVNPKKDTILVKSYKGFGTFEENFNYERIIGEWVLNYSIEADGKISPEGSFDIDLIFRD